MIPLHKHRQEENVDSWLMSYADMITLLLCFFIIFVSISEPKKEMLSEVTDGMKKRFGVVDLATPFAGIYRSMQSVAENHKILRDVAVERTATDVEMELASGAFYKPDSAELSVDKLPVLTDIAASIKAITVIDYRITVEGHSSDAPIATNVYPSNWELTSARAARLVRFLIEQGIDPARVRVAAYADTKPRVPNLDANGNPIPINRARNQRIVIKVERVL